MKRFIRDLFRIDERVSLMKEHEKLLLVIAKETTTTRKLTEDYNKQYHIKRDTFR